MWLPGLWKAYWRRAARCWDRGDFQEALDVAERYWRRRQTDPGAWLLESQAETLAGQDDRARATLQAGVRRHPESLELVTALAWILSDSGELDQAEALLTEAASREPTAHRPHIGLASIASRRGDEPKAMSHVELAWERLDPTDGDAAFRLAVLLLEIPNQRDRGTKLLFEVCEVIPEEPIPHLFAAALLEPSDPAAAAAHLDVARAHWRGSQEKIEQDFEYFRDHWLTEG